MAIKKEQFLSDLKVGDLVETIFVVSEKQVKKKKNGEDYCTVTLQDRGGTVEGVMWTEVFQASGIFAEGDLVEIKGILKEYRGSRQLIVNSLVKIKKDAGLDLSDYIKSTSKDIDSMFEEVLGYIGSIKNKHLKELLNSFMDDKKFATDYGPRPLQSAIIMLIRADCWSIHLMLRRSVTCLQVFMIISTGTCLFAAQYFMMWER